MKSSDLFGLPSLSLKKAFKSEKLEKEVRVCASQERRLPFVRKHDLVSTLRNTDKNRKVISGYVCQNRGMPCCRRSGVCSADSQPEPAFADDVHQLDAGNDEGNTPEPLATWQGSAKRHSTSGKELVDAIEGILGDMGQHVARISLRVDAVQLGTTDKQVHGSSSLATAISAHKQEAIASQAAPSQRVLRNVIVHLSRALLVVIRRRLPLVSR